MKKLNNKGSALVMAMMITLILTLLGTSMLGLAINEYRMQKTYSDSLRAYYLAEAALEKAIDLITTNEKDVNTISLPSNICTQTDKNSLNMKDNEKFDIETIEISPTPIRIEQKSIYDLEGNPIDTFDYKNIYKIKLVGKGTVNSVTKRVEAELEMGDYILSEDTDKKIEFISTITWKQI